jgi:cytochrome c553
MRVVFILIMSFFFVSCNNEKKEESKKINKEKLIMYQPSEMTKLMSEMYLFQEKSKAQIEKGELPLDFPEKFKKIHTAKLSDQFEHDISFQNFTRLFFKNIEQLNNSTKQNAKQNFNTAIQSCIACHQTTCTGPIKRIKKLVIK